MDRKMNVQIDNWIERRMDEKINGQIDEWINR